MSAISIPFFAVFTRNSDPTAKAKPSDRKSSATQQLAEHYQRAAVDAERTGDRRAAYFKAHCNLLAKLASSNG